MAVTSAADEAGSASTDDDTLPELPAGWLKNTPNDAAAEAAAEPKRKPTAAEAVAELELKPVGRDDWVQYFGSEADPTKRAQLIADCAFGSIADCGYGGILYAQTAEPCAYCQEETTECFPCRGAHKFCHKCRAENQEHAVERCPVCRTSFPHEDWGMSPEAATIYPKGKVHGRLFDRTFATVVHPMLRQLRDLDLTTRQPLLAEAERQAEEDTDELTETHKLLLMAKDVQTHHAWVLGQAMSASQGGETRKTWTPWPASAQQWCTTARRT
jgi:hypothetical protein